MLPAGALDDMPASVCWQPQEGRLAQKNQQPLLQLTDTQPS